MRPNRERDFAKYARLYWSYSSLEDDEINLFGGPLAVWSTMREGFMELQRQYPQSDFILNAYAKFACMADDAVSYGEVRPKLRDRPSSASHGQTSSHSSPAISAFPPLVPRQVTRLRLPNSACLEAGAETLLHRAGVRPQTLRD
jgi:hypothetical protein